MSNVLALTKILIKNNGFSFSSKKDGKKTKGNNPVAYLFVLAFCVACIGGPIIFSLSSILKVYDLSKLILSFVIPVGGLTTILFGVFSIVSVFYFSKDSEQLLHMPIKSHELLLAKFITSLISEYLILLLFIYPIILGVGIGVGASFIYYLYALIICLLMPVIPSVIMAIIVMLTNKLFNFGKRKDSFMYIMTGIILIFSFAYSFGIEYILANETSNEILALLSGNSDKYVSLSMYLFPLFNSATYALTQCGDFIGFAALMTFVGLNILFVSILAVVGKKLYIKGLIKNSGYNKNDNGAKVKEYKIYKSSVMGELIKKEWTTLKRTPIYMINIFLSNLIFPMILGISLIAGFKSGTGSISLRDYVDLNNGGALLVVIGILVMISSLTTAASSAISREGSSAWNMKIIPVSFKRQIDAKVYFSMILNMVVAICCEIVILMAFKAPWYYSLLITVPTILCLFIVNYLSILIDLAKPKLDWNNETEAVKQNFNVFLGMLLVMLLSMVIIGVGVILYVLNANIYLIFALACVILLGVNILINLLIKKNQGKLFKKVV